METMFQNMQVSMHIAFFILLCFQLGSTRRVIEVGPSQELTILEVVVAGLVIKALMLVACLGLVVDSALASELVMATATEMVAVQVATAVDRVDLD